MRNPSNNPTERIGRLLEELEELLFAFDQWSGAAMALPIEVLDALPPKPRLPNYEAEKVRRSLSYDRSGRRARLAAQGVGSQRELREKVE